MPLTTGTRLGPYEIESTVGAGGMGEVSRARDTRLDRTVAVKVLPEALAADPQFRERFDREARAISQLAHPNICTLYDVGESTLQGSGRGAEGPERISYLVMEYLEGETLAERLKAGPLPAEQGLQIAVQIAGALAHAHRAGIVHRDLKPGNIMLTRGGGPSGPPVAARQGSPQAKLLDFGLAKAATGGAKAPPLPHGTPQVGRGGPSGPPDLTAPPTVTTPLTAQGMILGTFQYMAPEQIQGHDADARTDIFALGCVLYEMLTGRRAFQGKSQVSVMAAILDLEPPPIALADRVCPPGLEKVVGRCLAKDPGERWQCAGDLASELKWAAEELGAGTPVGTATGVPASLASPRGRKRLLVAAAVLSTAVAGGVLTWLGIRWTSTSRPQPVRFAIVPHPRSRCRFRVPIETSPSRLTAPTSSTGLVPARPSWSSARSISLMPGRSRVSRGLACRSSHRMVTGSDSSRQASSRKCRSRADRPSRSAGWVHLREAQVGARTTPLSSRRPT